VWLFRHPYWSQLGSSEQARQLQSVTTIGFYAISRSAWDERWRDDTAFMVHCNNLPVEAISCRTSLVAEMKRRSMLLEPGDHPAHCRWVDGNFAEKPHLAFSAALSHRYGVVCLSHVQPHKYPVLLPHGPYLLR
jgi:hypothetical protein